MNKHIVSALCLLFILILLTSCTDSVFTDLGDHYIHRDPGPGYAYIFNSDYHFDYRDEAGSWVYAPTHTKYVESLIPCYVKEYAYDEKFIIAAQINSPKCLDESIREDALKTGYEVNYWIVIKEARQTVGPLSLEQYHVKREEFQVPDSLSLKEN